MRPAKRLPTLTRLGLAGMLSLALFSCKEGGTGLEPGTDSAPTAFRVEAPEAVTTGVPFELRVTALGSGGQQTLTSHSGAVALTVSVGTITPVSVQLSAGTGTVQASINGAGGPVTIRAAASGVEGTRALEVSTGAFLLPGDPTAAAASAIPAVRFSPRPEDYSADHPELPGFRISHNTLLLAFASGATVQQANAVLASLGAELAGGMPGPPNGSGILFLRLPTTSHPAMEAVVEALGQETVVEVAAQDALLGTNVIPRSNGNDPPGWTWEIEPTGGNWGLEMTRVPQMWNLNGPIEKSGNVDFGIGTGVLDIGFTPHVDLPFAANLTPSDTGTHGTAVAGVIGARFDNGVGIDGVNPFANLIVRGTEFPQILEDTLRHVSFGEVIMQGFADLVEGRTLPVVNISLGYIWYQYAIDTNTNARARRVAHDQGLLFRTLLSTLEAAGGGRLPVVVTAAGNGSHNGVLANQQARYDSPMNAAALIHEARNIIVVNNMAEVSGIAFLNPESSVGGHLSAPGTQVVTTTDGNSYGFRTGTSYASPHVAGLVGYLYALGGLDLPRPTLAHNPVLDLLLHNARPTVDGPPHVDAFATALDLERIQPSVPVLRMLLDIDDGTPDGNTRLTLPDNTEYTDDAEGGDGKVDMRDFRRFRDGLLQIETPAELSLDGRADHPKKDLNGDGEAGVPSDSIYPRGDFNGDGTIHRTATALVPGFAQPVTDLEVFKKLFEDLHYQTADLDALLTSADIVVHPKALLEAHPDATIRSYVHPTGASPPAEEDRRYRRLHTGLEELGNQLWQVYTVPAHPAGYTARVVVLTAAGDTILDAEKDFSTKPGEDSYWDHQCGIHTGNLTLTTQAEVEGAAGVCEIRGSLQIIELPGTSDPVVSLEPLRDLRRLLRGSGNYSLTIASTSALTDLSGLERLSMEPSPGFTIRANTALTSLNGLGTLAEPRLAAMYELLIENNPVLTDISSIANLLESEGVRVTRLSIGANPSLSSLVGLGAIQRAHSVGISGPGITSLDDLNLEIVTGVLGISQTNLSSFAQFLTVYPPAVQISRNPVLQDLTLTGDSLGWIGISNNGSLLTASIDYARGIPNIRIEDEPTLTSLDLRMASGMAELVSIQRTGLRSISTSTLTSIEPRPFQLGAGLYIVDNLQLEDIDEFRKITSFNRFLVISGNRQLCVPEWFYDVPVTQSRNISSNGSCP